jgi:hypothetical protein
MNDILPISAKKLPIITSASKIDNKVIGIKKIVFHFFNIWSKASLAEKKLSPLSCLIVIDDTAVLDAKIVRAQNIMPA